MCIRDRLYSTTSTQFTPRPRLSGTVEPSDPVRLGQGGSPGKAIQAALMHNVNDRLLFGFSTEIYDGFLYNYEDNEFVVLDDTGFRNWFLVRSRFSDATMLRFKITHDRPITRTNVDIRNFNDPTGVPFEGDNVRRKQTSFRLQLD